MWRVLVVLLFVQSVFSLWPILVKVAIENGVNAILLSFTRDVFASGLLWTGVWLETGRPNLWNVLVHTMMTPVKMYHLEPHEKSLFLFLGVCSSINSVGYVIALEYVTPFNSALLHPTIPVFAATLGALFGVERLTPRKILGTCICIAGSIVVVVSQADLTVKSSLVGNLLLVLQSLAMASLLVGQKFVPQRHTSLKTTAVYYTIGALVSAPISITVLSATDGFSAVGLKATGVISFGALFVIAFNYAALTWANKKSSPSVPATSMMLQPPLTFLLGYIIGDRPSAGGWELGGGAVIIAGLILTTLPTSFSEGDSILNLGAAGLQDDYENGENVEGDEKMVLSRSGFVGGGDDFTTQYKSMATAPGHALTKRTTSGTSYISELLSPLSGPSALRSSSPSAGLGPAADDDYIHLLSRPGE
jgi:drug/metabolite transporter (DMT)-like permease